MCAHCRPLPLAGRSTPRFPVIPPAPLVQPQTAVWLQNLVARAAIRTSGVDLSHLESLIPAQLVSDSANAPSGKKKKTAGSLSSPGGMALPALVF